MATHTIQFGTDGWRALLDTEINTESVALVAQAFADYITELKPGSSVAVAYDGRRLSYEFAHLFAGILDANGLRVHVADEVVPTPVLSYYVVQHEATAGVMITASHNPGQYNGIKFKQANGGPFFTEETQKIEALIGQTHVPAPSSYFQQVDMWRPYRAHLETLIDLRAIARSGLRVAIDSMHGAGRTFLQEIFERIGLEAHTLAGNTLYDFGGRLAEPIEQNLAPLAALLRNGNYALGLATDGDADRLGVLTDRGEWMNIQETILYLAQFYGQKMGGGPLVKTLSVTDKMRALAAPHPLLDVQVGFKYVAEAMLQSNAVFGAEESGGFGFRGHLPERDGIFSALVFVEMLAQSGHKTLSDFMAAKRAELGSIAYARIDQHEHRPHRHELLPRMHAARIGQVAQWQVVEQAEHYSSRGVVNSLKLVLEGPTRWLLLRSSETEPMVRIYAEGQSMDEVQTLLREGQKLLERF